MTIKEFNKIVEESFERSRRVLSEKSKRRTTSDGDRLGNFKVSKRNPAESLATMAEKHISDFIDMAKHPHNFTLSEWYETTVDLRNYTILMEAIIEEMKIR